MRTLFSALGAFALLLFSGLLCLLPRAWAHWLGRRIGGLALVLSARSRRTALENLKLRLGVEGRRAWWIANKSMGQAGAAIVEMLRAPRIAPATVERDLEIAPDARATLEEVRSSPRGAVFASCHLGNWEFLNLCAPVLCGGRPTAVVMRAPPYPFVGRVVMWLRARTGQRIFQRTRAILRSLALVREGGAVWTVFDVSVPPQAGAVPIAFLGVPTFTTIAPAYVAVRTQASLLFCCLLPLGGARYRLHLRRIEAVAEGTPRERATALMQQLTRELEAAVREHPEHWAWWLKRWNIRPEGAPGAWPSYAHDERHALADGRVPQDLDA
jgi:KDO2-lipid IV(A) lauroyltransferase